MYILPHFDKMQHAIQGKIYNSAHADTLVVFKMLLNNSVIFLLHKKKTEKQLHQLAKLFHGFLLMTACPSMLCGEWQQLGLPHSS